MGCTILFANWGSFIKVDFTPPNDLIALEKRASNCIGRTSNTISTFIYNYGSCKRNFIFISLWDLGFWLGWCWFKEKSWKLSLTGGVVIGTLGFLLRVIALSTLVGDNLWVLITRASYGLIEKFIGLFNLPLYPSIVSIQLGAILLIIFQEIVYVLTVHVVAYSLFPRFKLTIPDPPKLLNSLVDFSN